MQLITYGINHETAPLALREQLVFDAVSLPEALQNLLQQTAMNEAVLLSTCNRTEIYSVGDNPDAIADWLVRARLVDHHDALNAHSYCYHDMAAVQHLIRVASGLDSMVLGESQILAQMKQAYQAACDVGAVGDRLQHLFPNVFAASKQIRHQTEIGAHPVSLAYAVVQLAKRLFSSLKDCRVLLIGAGETIELVATHLIGQGISHLTFANRTIEKGAAMAEAFAGQAIRIGDIPKQLADVDMVITATASQLPILGKGTIESALRQRKHRPIFIADLAMPRDVEPQVSELEDVYLYNLDMLNVVIQDNLKNRKMAAKQAEEMVMVQASHYVRQLRVEKAGAMIRELRDSVDDLRDQELKKALDHWRRTQNPEAALALLAHNLTNKVMHQPTVKMREAIYHGQSDLLKLIKDSFK